MQRTIFRQAALEQLAAPEELDQLIQITTPRSWLALLALFGLIITVVAWSFTDTIPTDVVGRGMLIRGGRVLSVTATAAGTIEKISVQVGDNIQKGQVIATIRPRATGNGAANGQPSTVESAYAGRVVDIGVAPGSTVDAGVTLAVLEETAKPLEAVIYMLPEKGKNVQPGMTVQISPVNLKREEYGFMPGRVRSIATFPASFQSMMLVLANEQLVRQFLADGAPLEVRIDLQPDPAAPSGYHWSSSQGPLFPISSGTLALATITLEEQHPINLVLPKR